MSDIVATKKSLALAIDKLDAGMKSGTVRFDDWTDIRASIGAVYNVMLGLTSELIKTFSGADQRILLEIIASAEQFIHSVELELGDSNQGADHE